MPGAPNRPPETEAPPAPSPAEETAEERIVRRLAPSRVVLRLPIWRGAPAREVVEPLTGAEEHLARGDLVGAEHQLDQLAIRFAEPRWPSLPEPFRPLRVPIPSPQPPHWDPENALAPAEREAHRRVRYAHQQLALARASIEAESARGTELSDLAPALAAATAAAAGSDFGPAFWGPIDQIWRTIRTRVPLPGGPAAAGTAAHGASP